MNQKTAVGIVGCPSSTATSDAPYPAPITGTATPEFDVPKSIAHQVMTRRSRKQGGADDSGRASPRIPVFGHGAALVTRNVAEFSRVQGLEVIDWHA